MTMSDAQPHQSASLAARVNEYATAIKWCSIGVIAIALLWTMRSLPGDRAVQAAGTWVESLGVWGPLAFGLVYILATVLLLPASALTLAAGAVFGLGIGMVTISLASTIGAGLAFLIARYFARDKMAAIARKNPKFDEIDGAIGEGGWKIVALLRLSPAVPFNLQNYAYGLTSIRFWTCVLTSWFFMLPGTFMYVYLGKAVGIAAFTATGAGREKTIGEWALLGLGLIATVLVTVYVTRLATKAIKQRTRIEAGHEGSQPSSQKKQPSESAAPSWPWAATIIALVAVLLASAAACARLNRDVVQRLIGGLFGPPVATLNEAYQETPAGPTFDHSLLDGLLRTHVDEHGWVDYNGLREDAEQLDQYVASLAEAPFDEMGRSEKLALLINAYNAFTLRLILDYWDGGGLKSIKDIPGNKRWDDQRWQIGSFTWSLNAIEHEQLRPKFKEPRVHFALVCAAVGCPTLRSEAYLASRIDGQLEDQTRYAHTHDRWFRFEADSNEVHLTQLYDWYGGDFEQVAGSVLEYAAQYSDELKQALAVGNTPSINWLNYDWTLNDKSNTK